MNSKPSVRVLAIEDDEDDYLITVDSLDDITGTDYEVTWVQTAAQGIEALRRHEHDVCLLDYRLGADTGLDVLRAVQTESISTPCILLTGQHDEDTDRAAMDAGAVDYLIKGRFTENDLERSVRYAIGHAAAIRSLRESQARFRSVFEAANDGIALIDGNGQLVSANEAACRMFGMELGSFRGRNFREMLDEKDVDAVVSRFADRGVTQSFRSGSVDATGRRADGSTFPVELSVAQLQENGSRFWTVVVRDVTEQTELLDQLTHHTLHDRLTGLANRTLLRERIGYVLGSIDALAGTPALLLLDVDNFKRVNDVQGHEVADHLLRLIGERLRGCVGTNSTVARLGGDEFALFVERIDGAHAALRLAESVRVAVNRPFRVRDHEITISCSIGIAVPDGRTSQADEVIRNADVAMYTAKGDGKNCVELFDTAMYGSVLRQIYLEKELREAIDGDQIQAHFQPIVHVATGTPIAAEALARWVHPDEGPISPVEFIAAAERGGLIGDLGRLVLRQSVLQAVEWQATFGESAISVSVNVSSDQLADHNFVPFVSSLLDECGLRRGGLSLEITESVMLGDVDAVISRLNELRTLGVGLALDDFGTGYSSLSYLQRLPVDVLKLDRSFVVESNTDRGRALVEAVSSMSRAFGMTSVAEGIETEEQRGLLADLGFELAQGYLFSRPLPAADITEYLHSHFDVVTDPAETPPAHAVAGR